MKVLVSVASRHGATQEMGGVVAEQLRAAGHEVDEVAPDDVEHVERYEAVVLGSSVYVGRLALGLRDLVDRQGGQLRERPVWLFWSGPVGDPPVPETVPDDVAVIARTVHARGVQVFPGRLDRDELNISERALVALTRADAGDFRDLDQVREWSQEIVRELQAVVRGM